MSVHANNLGGLANAAGTARVVQVEAIPVALPLRHPVSFASGSIKTADNVLVRIHSDVGVVGCAEAQPRPYTYGETQESIIRALRAWFAPRLIPDIAAKNVRSRAGSAYSASNVAALPSLASFCCFPVRNAVVRCPQCSYNRWLAISRIPPM